ncbi:MAG: hypothetical protein HC914_08170, partial [Chloroflexaceae bacterium]|nr:hypothetical protein [Chloroflexaceae bacterium]
MAHAAPSDRTLPSAATQRPPRALALPRLGAAAPWPPLVLALLTLLALIAAYSVRPTVQVDLGDYYDSIYVQGFHARELDAINVGQTVPWPADIQALTIPGERNGDQLITIEAFDDLPDRPLSLVALTVNDVPVRISGSSSHRFTAFVPAELAAAPTLTLRLRPALTGGQEPTPGVVEQATIAPARTYRWSRDESQIVFPGLGRGDWRVDLAIVAAHPNGQPVEARIYANGTALANLPDHGELRRVSLLVPASLMANGDLEITLRSNTYDDPRPLGLFVEGVRVAPAGVTSTLQPVPPGGVLLAGLTTVLGLYACLVVLFRGLYPPAAPQPTRAVWGAAAGAVLVIGVLAWALAAHRFPTSFMLPGVAGLVAWSVLLLVALRWLLLRVFPSARFTHAILLLFFVSYWLKAVGMLYPYFIAIDVHWHMARVRWILDGQLPLLYGTNSPLNESTMPVAEWGVNRPVIPYSPYFHMFATLFALSPWSLEFTNNMFSALVDTSRILIVGLVALRGGLSQRGALLAAALLAVLPVNFLLHSWGNAPTTFGLWWACVVTALLVSVWPRLHQRGPFFGLIGLLLGAFLIYTVAGAFTGLFLVLFSLAVWLAAWRSKLPDLTRPLRPLWLAVAAAVVLVMLIYYGQYIAPILERTVPYFVEAFTEGHEDSGRVGDTLGAYLLRHVRLETYGLVVPLVLATVYLIWGWLSRFRIGQPAAPADTPPDTHAVVLWAAVAGWYGVVLLFLPLAYTIPWLISISLVAIPPACDRYCCRARLALARGRGAAR